MSQPSKGIAAILAAIFGPLGVDKFYAGHPMVGLVQLILTLTIIGMVVSIPWAYLSVFVLVLAILWNTTPAFYPKTNWAPRTDADTTIAWVAVGLVVLSMAVSIIAGAMNVRNVNTKKKEDDKKKNGDAPAPPAVESYSRCYIRN